jgi:transposase
MREAHERALHERRAEPWEAPALRGVTRVRRLMAVEIEAMVVDYQTGMGCVQLARKYGVSDNTVLVRLKAAGVELRPRGKLTPTEAAELVRLRREGWTLTALAERYGVTRAAVHWRLQR